MIKTNDNVCGEQEILTNRITILKAKLDAIEIVKALETRTNDNIIKYYDDETCSELYGGMAFAGLKSLIPNGDFHLSSTGYGDEDKYDLYENLYIFISEGVLLTITLHQILDEKTQRSSYILKTKVAAGQHNESYNITDVDKLIKSINKYYEINGEKREDTLETGKPSRQR